MRLKSAIVFFIIVFILNNLLNWVLSLGQDLSYIAILSMVTTVLFYFLMAMRDKWSS